MDYTCVFNKKRPENDKIHFNAGYKQNAIPIRANVKLVIKSTETQTILQSYSNQDSMVLAQKQKYRTMEQDRKPRDKPTHIWSPYL